MSHGVVTNNDLLCPHNHGWLLPRESLQAFVCPECAWGVSGAEVAQFTNGALGELIESKHIGSQYQSSFDWDAIQ